MQHNRKLHISTAGTRKTKHWPETEILWSEFADRVKTPVRSTETVEEYLAMPKYRQDELKDVGGFVGGTFENNIRKAAYVKGRDLLTLDMDNIPAGGTDEILKRVSGLGCAALVYSTRKHAGYAPRLRVIVPLDATASADEYEPASRKLASLIGMEFCDPTTFDVSRLMYWPSCCKDGEYIFEVYDHPFCSLSGSPSDVRRLDRYFAMATGAGNGSNRKETACETGRPDHKARNHRCILPDIHNLSGNGEVHTGDV